MAITNHAELKTAIGNWLNRSDLTSRDEEFITLAEAGFNRDLRTRDMESTVTIALVLGTKDYAIDSNIPDLLDIKSVSIASTPVRTLDSYAPDVLNDLWSVDPNGQPKGYTFFQDTIRVGPAPDSTNAVNMTVTYYKKIPALSAGANWLITDHPDVYLYGALMQAIPYLKDDTRVPIIQSMFAQSVAKIKDVGVVNE